MFFFSLLWVLGLAVPGLMAQLPAAVAITFPAAAIAAPPTTASSSTAATTAFSSSAAAT
jgi:hypothetical protein